MPRTRDEDSGQYRTAYRDEDFLDAIRAADGQPSTPEIADTLGCADRTALVRLHQLADAGKVKRRKTGAVNLWSISDDENGDQEDESAFARELSQRSIANQYGDDYFGQNPDWAADLPDLGENA